MKTREIRDLKPKERAEKLREARAELMHERGVAAMGGAVRNPGKMRALRTDIARILTVQTQGAEKGPVAKRAPTTRRGKMNAKKEAGK